MKILFECNDGTYVVEVISSRLYAKVHPDKEDIHYDGKYNLLLNPAGFHEYREEEAMLQNKINKLISDDLKKAMK